MTVSCLPRFGEDTQPAMGEVAVRYIEKGLEETGATNIVAGMILDYRAFDTFGESCVLFCAVVCVFMLLRSDLKEGEGYLELYEDDRIYEPKNDAIIQKSVAILAPIIILFGFYIVLNGHLSAGGGFSGGAVIGSGMILFLLAFGFGKAGRIFTQKLFRIVTSSALIFYCLAKSYAFFTGANGLENSIPLGAPGAILSAGLILPLNICVGMIVACTMYAFYVMFRKGSF
jgi:multicomponent Na+:H+ antiporter subunit B